MKRPSNMSKLHAFIDELRAAMPDLVLRTSFIAGFPGETDAEFDEPRLRPHHPLRSRRLLYYSRQQWTGAYDMSEQVPDEVKRQRRDRFMRQQQRIAAKCARTFVGRELDMPVEGTGEDEDGSPVVAGRTYREAPEVDGMVFARGVAELNARKRPYHGRPTTTSSAKSSADGPGYIRPCGPLDGRKSTKRGSGGRWMNQNSSNRVMTAQCITSPASLSARIAFSEPW